MTEWEQLTPFAEIPDEEDGGAAEWMIRVFFQQHAYTGILEFQVAREIVVDFSNIREVVMSPTRAWRQTGDGGDVVWRLSVRAFFIDHTMSSFVQILFRPLMSNYVIK